MKNMFNKTLLFFVSAYLFTMSGCPIGPSPNPPSEGIPDPLINQPVLKGENWQQIVQDKLKFALGESTLVTTQYYHYGTFNYYYRDYGTFPAIDGSTVLVPLAAEFCWQFLDFDVKDMPDMYSQNTIEFLNFSTTSGAYSKLINGDKSKGQVTYYQLNSATNSYDTTDYYVFSKTLDIVLATHPSAEELNMADNAGIELIIEPICYDSFVFITHRDNPVESLTVEQIQKIYSGEITNWRDVGGEDLRIIAYQREPNSGSQTAMEEMVMKGIPMTKAPQAKIAVGMGILIEEVAGYENGTMSLGYTYKYYVDRLYHNPEIKILKVNGVMPADENIRNNTYPFIAPYNAVIRSSDIDKTGGKFLDWILSHEGQLCVAQAGYVTLQDMN